MEQVKSFCRRYRRLLLAAAYLAIFAVGVLYLRVTVNIPPEGDDKLTLNLWLYDFQRMPFWQYALQDLQERLRYFTLQEVRFFPFHYPNAVDLLFYTSLTHYRLYIIAWTGAAAFAVSRVAARLGSGDALALGGFALVVERGSRHGHSTLSGCHVFGSCTALLEQLGQRGGFFIETLAFLIELNRCALELGIDLVAFRFEQLLG